MDRVLGPQARRVGGADRRLWTGQLALHLGRRDARRPHVLRRSPARRTVDAMGQPLDPALEGLGRRMGARPQDAPLRDHRRLHLPQRVGELHEDDARPVCEEWHPARIGRCRDRKEGISPVRPARYYSLPVRARGRRGQGPPVDAVRGRGAAEDGRGRRGRPRLSRPPGIGPHGLPDPQQPGDGQGAALRLRVRPLVGQDLSGTPRPAHAAADRARLLLLDAAWRQPLRVAEHAELQLPRRDGLAHASV